MIQKIECDNNLKNSNEIITKKDDQNAYNNSKFKNFFKNYNNENTI